MPETDEKNWNRFLSGKLFSPAGFLFRAVILAVIFLIMELLGLRTYTSVLSGASPSGMVGDKISAVLGWLYIIFYFGFVVLTPILLLASLMFWLFVRWDQRLQGSRPAAQPHEAAPTARPDDTPPG
jgi:hypothetical protein